MSRPGQKPRRKVDLSWTPDLAYVCGLMATDGCLASDGRHLNLTSNDLDQLETFKKCLDIKANISWKKSGFTGKLSPQLQFGDVVLYKWFLAIGLTPNKTKTIGKLSIPDQYFFDYLRGEFDGDGSSNAYWDARWRSSVCIYTNFVCASKDHLEWLNQTVFRLIMAKGVIKKGKRVFSLSFAKANSYLLYQEMYYSKHIPFLKRKKDKLDRQWLGNELAKTGQAPMELIRGSSVLRIA